MSSGRGQRLRAATGRLIVAAAVVAAAVAARRNYDDVRLAISDARWPMLAAAVAGAVATVGLLALVWHAALEAIGAPQPVERVARWFAVGQLGKYVPGGIWHLVGQGELARRDGVPGRLAYGSVALSNVGIIAGGAVVVACGGLAGAVDSAPWWVAAAGAASAGAIAVAPVRRRVARVLRLDERISLGLPALLRLAAAAAPAWAAIGVSTWCVTQSLSIELPLATVVIAAVASWLAGILTLPAPGGLGVREAAFIALIAPQVGTSLASVAAVSARLVFVGADIACWVGGRVWLSVVARRAASSTAVG